MDNKLQQILDGVSLLYMKYGIKSVTMDDVAKELGISKKTLYLYVKDKEDLVKQVVSYHITKQNCEFDHIELENMNAIDVLLHVSQQVLQFFSDFTPNVRYDLQKYYPTVLKLFSDHRNEHIYKNIRTNLDKGIKDGLYRNNIDPHVIAATYVSRIDVIFDNTYFPHDKYSFSHLFQELFTYHIYGIASKKGIEYYEKRIKDNSYVK